MRAVLRLAAHNLRARWPGWAVLALLLGAGAECGRRPLGLGPLATNVGLPPGAIMPVPLLIPVTLAAANVIALRPGQLIARLSPAAVLRGE